MRIRLSKIRGGSAIRTKTVTGVTANWPPVVGRRFALIAEALSPGGIARLVSTSPVVSAKKRGRAFVIETENSVYRLEMRG